MAEEEKIPEEESPGTGSPSPVTEDPQPEINEPDTGNPNPVTEPSTLNFQPQTSPMEVHHHGHVHERKKWKEYVFQFFMLFLAVFCGFLAEYQLEHMIENNREKQFMSSLVKDLELDTSSLALANRFRLNKIGSLDSTVEILANEYTSTVPILVYNLSRKLYGGRAFFQNSGTLDQLKNSGGLRLINNRKIVDSIESYHQQVRRMQRRDDVEIEIYTYNQQLSARLFDTKSVIKTIARDDNGIAMPDSIPININLMYLNEYLNNLIHYKEIMTSNIRVFEANKRKASNLLQLIKKEYHLQDE